MEKAEMAPAVNESKGSNMVNVNQQDFMEK